MAGTLPTPRSYQTILGDMIAAFLSRYGLRGLRAGNPLLGILEASAQSDVRNTQDIFNLLDARDIDRAIGLALDRLAADDDVFRLPATASSGLINVLDNSFVKTSTKVYPGTSAPNAGTSALKVSDASSFPASGSVYIGRGTLNYEGPIPYSAVTQSGTFWIFTLGSTTQKFHDVNESVILAQGGDRIIPSGSIVRTAQGNAATAVSFATLAAATILDGETEVDSVAVICQEIGAIGNIQTGAIVEFVAPPFTGAIATNPSPFDTGYPVESDTLLRERIKNKRQTKAKGTALALITEATGVIAPDENKTVISASVFAPQGEPATLFIDDGTGYEESNTGVAIQSLVDQALGGEDRFALGDFLPVTKAFVKTTLTAPFALVAASQLAAKVAGVLTFHSFDESEFRSISNATAYEVVAAINGDPNLLFAARTADNGTTVVLFARADTDEDIELVVPDNAIDANDNLGFPSGINYTLRLYKDDKLLFKDGRSAIILTAPQSQWNTGIATGVYIKVQVDGTKARVYKIVDQDFVDANTGFTSVNVNNSLDSWVAVFNAKIPGVTAINSSGRLQFISNRGASASAALVFSEPISSDKDIDGITVTDATNNLIKKGMFTAAIGLSSIGQSNDYSLNRNTGELKLTKSLAAGSALSAGTVNTRAYIQSASISSAQVTFVSNANLFVVVDGAASVVPTGVNSALGFNLTAPAGSRRRYQTSPSTAVFQNLKKGDWAIIWDNAFTVRGAWRVAYVDLSFTYFEVEREVTHADQTGVVPSSGGMVFVRSDAAVQQITLASGVNRTLSSIVTELNGLLGGATASVVNTSYLRITTNTFASNGDIFLATADVDGQKLLLPVMQLVQNVTSHMASIESRNTESGTPASGFQIVTVTALPGTLGTTLTLSSGVAASNVLRWLTKTPSSSIGYGNNVGQFVTVKDVGGSNADLNVTMDRTILNDRIVPTRPFAISTDDNLLVTLDENETGKEYNIPLYRNIKPVAGQSYSATGLQVLDADNGNVALSVAFGSTNANLFQDFALQMRARGKSHAAGGGSAPAGYANNKALLWRFARFGPDGNQARVSYVNPTAPNAGFSVATANGQYADIQISLPSDVVRTGLSLFATTKFTVAVTGGSPADTVVFTYSKPTATLQRTTNVVTVTTGSTHGFVAGDVVYVTSGDVNFPSGAKTVVTAADTTHFTYNEAAADAGPSAGQAVSSAPADPNFASVVVGDIVSIGALTGFATANTGAYRVTAKTSTSFTVLRLPGTASAQTTPVSIKAATNLQFYPIKIASTAASAVATWVNANALTLVTAVAIENGGGAPGTGVIDRATIDEYLAGYNNATGSSLQTWPLTDGELFVQISNLGASPNTITLKSAVASDLVSNSDFDNETLRLVPITTDALARYLSSSAVSGLYAGGALTASSRNSHLQLNTNTIGSTGAVQVSGGSANAASAAVVGSGIVVDSTYSKVTVPAAQIKGLAAYRYVAVQGTNVQAKQTALTSASKLTSVAANGANWTVTFDTSLVTVRQTLTDTADQWQVDKVGNFACYQLIDGGSVNAISGVHEGDWVVVSLKTASPVNIGTFHVVRVSSSAFWVENVNAVNEVVAVDGTAIADSVKFYSYDSVMPGDQLTIDTVTFGTLNRGTFIILDNSGGTSVVVKGSMQAYSGTSTLGADINFLRFIEKDPIRLIKHIWVINQSPGSTAYYDVVFDTSDLATKMSSSAGASLQALDKLNFSTSLVAGADAYSYSTGLIAEVNKVMYGDPENPSVYPGVVAAGAQVNISGPLVRRITVALAIRLRSTISSATAAQILSNVKSAVASAINKAKQGQSVAISSLVAAGESVDGVISVIPINPTYSTSDLIAIQPNEKARVLDVDQDITVSIVGN